MLKWVPGMGNVLMLFSESSSRLKVRACVRVSATGTFMCSCDGYRNVYACVCQLQVRLCVRVSATGMCMCVCVERGKMFCELGLDGKIILRQILSESLRLWGGFIWIRSGTIGGLLSKRLRNPNP